MFSLRRTLHALPRQTAGRAFIARPVIRPVTRFYSDSSSSATQTSTPATENSTLASTPENTTAAAPSTGAAENAKGPGEKLADSLSKKTPPPPKRAVPVKKPISIPVKKAAPTPVKKPADTAAKKPEPRPAPASANGERRPFGISQAIRLTSDNPGKPSNPNSEPAEIRAPTSTLKNTYEATTVTFASPKEHATENDVDVPWDNSFHGISTRPVTAWQFKVLMRPIDEEDIEVKPDGIIYLPEIKYRRRLNEAFGPMGWGMIPKGEPVVGQSVVTREYALIVDGRFVSQAQGENNYYSAESLPSAVEGCKSNALMRCCKDLGIASDLWDPRFIRSFKKEKMEEVWVEHMVTKKKRAMWFKKGQVEVSYPYKRT